MATSINIFLQLTFPEGLFDVDVFLILFDIKVQ